MNNVAIINALKKAFVVAVNSSNTKIKLNYMLTCHVFHRMLNDKNITMRWLIEQFAEAKSKGLKNKLNNLVNFTYLIFEYKYIDIDVNMLDAELINMVKFSSNKKRIEKLKYYGAINNPTLVKFNKFTIGSFSIRNWANVITIMDDYLRRKISITNLACKSWEKDMDLKKYIDNFDRIADIIIYEISSTKKKLDVIKIVLNIAKKCLKYNNFNGVMALMCGINTCLDNNLSKLVESNKLYIKLNKITNSTENYKNLRQLFRDAKYPKIPYFGLIMKDIIFVYQGNNIFTNNFAINTNFINLLSIPLKQFIDSSQIPYKLKINSQCCHYYNKINVYNKDSTEPTISQIPKQKQLDIKVTENKKRKSLKLNRSVSVKHLRIIYHDNH